LRFRFLRILGISRPPRDTARVEFYFFGQEQAGQKEKGLPLCGFNDKGMFFFAKAFNLP